MMETLNLFSNAAAKPQLYPNDFKYMRLFGSFERIVSALEIGI